MAPTAILPEVSVARANSGPALSRRPRWLPVDNFLSGSTSGAKRELASSKETGSRAVGGTRPHDSVSYDGMESVQYLVPDTCREEYFFRNQSPSTRSHRNLMLWTLYAAIGMVVSVVILGTLYTTDYIAKVRAKWAAEALSSGDVFGAWVVWTGSSMALCAVAVLLVFLEPAAASSGIPGLIAFLNGVMPKGGRSPILGSETSFISLSTLAAKLLGMICSIPSGLCIGPEGPIIHISALLGHWTTRLVQRAERIVFPHFSLTAASSSEARDFLATGAACGICVAFRAPLAGCLFVVEEAASFFTTRHLEYTFFACVVAYYVAQVLANPEDGFTKFKQPTGYFCDSNFVDGTDIILVVLLAVLGGIMGALFNEWVEKLSHFRLRHVNVSAWRRAAEVLVLVLATGSVAVFLPAAFPCRESSRDLMMRDSTGCLGPDDLYQISHGEMERSHLLNIAQTLGANESRVLNLDGSDWAPHSSAEATGEAWANATLLDNNERFVKLHYSHAYSCAGNHSFSGMAMLWLNGGVKGVKVLMQRGFPRILSAAELLAFCVVYFVLACFTTGVSVPAGLVVPMLLIGGSFGRLVGVMDLELKSSACSGLDHEEASNAFYWSAVYRWVGRDCNLPDPGVFAVVGMAAFLGGSGRITLFLATMIVELTGDVSLIPPVGCACMIAMIIGNKFNHGLYHGLIPVFSLPFLNAAPADVMYLAEVAEVMASNVIVLVEQPAVSQVRELIARVAGGDLTHHAFPVVDKQQRLRGIIGVDYLRDALEEADFIAEKEEGAENTNADDGDTVDLMNYADRSPITVFTRTKVARAFEIFRKLGLRHLCVIDESGILRGILTRKDLMSFKVDDAIKRQFEEGGQSENSNGWPPDATQFEIAVASMIHNTWRSSRGPDPACPDNASRFKPRFKKVGDAEIDIANTVPDDLPRYFKRENLIAASVGCGKVREAWGQYAGRTLKEFHRFLRSNDFMEPTAAALHEDWVLRNKDTATADQKLPYERLSEVEKEINRENVRICIRTFVSQSASQAL